MSINNDKLLAIDAAMNQIEKQFGKGSIMKLGATTQMGVEAISTGCLALDMALGIGGIPKAGLSRYTDLNPREIQLSPFI
jgi:recombination protein RecA